MKKEPQKEERRKFSPVMKKEILAALDSGKKSIEQVEREFDISRHFHIARWRQSLAKTGGQRPIPRYQKPKEEFLAPILNGTSLPNSNDPRDREIVRLKLKLADVMIENEKLKAKVYGRRVSDQYYMEQRGEEEDFTR
jgi:transposase-like protein